MIQLTLSTLVAILMAFVGYAFGAEITGNVVGSVLFAIVGFAVGWWVAALAFARTRRGRSTTVR